MGRPRRDITLDLFLRLFELDEPEEVVVSSAEPSLLNKPARCKAPKVRHKRRPDTVVYESVVDLTTSRTSVQCLVKPGLLVGSRSPPDPACHGRDQKLHPRRK